MHSKKLEKTHNWQRRDNILIQSPHSWWYRGFHRKLEEIYQQKRLT